MSLRSFCACVSLVVVLCLAHNSASAQVTIGPGDVAAGNTDQAPNLIAVDLTITANLSPGTYLASQFNYQFAGGTAGMITPLVLVADLVTPFTPVAIGDPVPQTSGLATSFISTTFGGNSIFTLTAPSVVFAGIYWQSAAGSSMPVGFLNGAGNSLVRFGGANAPTLGVPIGGGTQGTFARTYDFSVTFAPVPEPTSMALALTGACAGFFVIRRR